MDLNADDTHTCVVCYEHVELIELECGHNICCECGRSWFVKKSECPTCRRGLSRSALALDFNISETPITEENSNQNTNIVIDALVEDLRNVGSNIRAAQLRSRIIEACVEYAGRRELPFTELIDMTNAVIHSNIGSSIGSSSYNIETIFDWFSD